MGLAPGAVSVFSSAKINLFLEVIGKRPDGYHDIDSVFVEVDMRETLRAEATERPEIVLECSDPSLPTDAGNLAVRAVNMVRDQCGIRAGMRLTLEKRIPPGSGLGGGSANAAAALRLADAVWNTRLDQATLSVMAAALGSDVPFFLRGGTCRCRGRGDVIDALPDAPPGCRMVLALPEMHSDTGAAYRGLKLPDASARRRVEPFLAALAAGDAAAMEDLAFNRFEESVFAALPDLGRLRDELSGLSGRPVRMSGSGAALWHFADADYAAAVGDDPKLAAWSAANGVRLVPVRAVPGAEQPAGNGNRMGRHFA